MDSDFPEPDEPHFAALGHSGSEHYTGLETFPNPGCVLVKLKSDEVMSICPITKQPDFYNVSIELAGTENLIESKSLKIWFQNIMRNSFLHDRGMFGETLAVFIREQICEAIEAPEEQVQVTVVQKSRGGISITAVA